MAGIETPGKGTMPYLPSQVTAALLMKCFSRDTFILGARYPWRNQVIKNKRCFSCEPKPIC